MLAASGRFRDWNAVECELRREGIDARWLVSDSTIAWLEELCRQATSTGATDD